MDVPEGAETPRGGEQVQSFFLERVICKVDTRNSESACVS